MATKYELQAARIETTLAAYRVSARVWECKVTPRFVRFDVTTALGARLTKIAGLEEELALSLGVRTVTVNRDGGVLHVEIPRDTPRTVELEPLCLQCHGIPAYTAVLGVDTGGDPLLLSIDSPDVAHVLLAGTTGSGKTVLLRTILTTLAMHNRAGLLQLVLIDPKGRGFGPLAALPHVWHGLGAIQDPRESLSVLLALVAEMERRDRLNRNLPRIVVAIDELADLLQVLGKPASDAVQRLTQRGREAGIHVIAATQRPAADAVSGLIKANFPIRLVGSVASTDDAEVAAGRGGTGAEKLLGKGDCLLVGKGQPIRFQTAFADTRQLALLAARIRAGGARRRSWTAAPAGQWESLPLGGPAPRRRVASLPTNGAGGVTGSGDRVVTVTGDRPGAHEKSSPVDISRDSEPQSPVTDARSPDAVTSPLLHPDGLGGAVTRPLSDAQRLDALLPPGVYLPMVEPSPARREILALAYRVEGGFRPMCRRVYGLSPSGEVRRNGRVRTWLDLALQEHTLAGPDPATTVEEEAADEVR